MPPKVSVCIPVYNRTRLLRVAIWSVLNQTYRDFELLVSDNASEDDLETEVFAPNDPRVRLFRQKRNIGGVANFCFLQSVARGDYVIFLCSDDLLLPDCLEKAVSALDSQPHRGGVIYMAAHYSEAGFQFLSRLPDRDYAAADDYATDRTVSGFTFTATSLCLYRRNVFERLGGWNQRLLAVIDWDLYSRVVRLGGGVIFLHEVLSIIRSHEDQMSNTSALHWGFYHDVMLLGGQPEYNWKNTTRAKAMMEQLLWDWRLRRSPWRTVAHAYRTNAFPGVLLCLPWEILRRLMVKVRGGRGQSRSAHVDAPGSLKSSVNCDFQALEQFWGASELVRLGS